MDNCFSCGKELILGCDQVVFCKDCAEYSINWKTPSEGLPDVKREVICAWFDGQVTYHNYAHAIRWDHVEYWSYMPKHPKER